MSDTTEVQGVPLTETAVPGKDGTAAAPAKSPDLTSVNPSSAAKPDGAQWTVDSLVSLFDSTREEVRSFRSQFYGSVAAAFLLPIATLAVQWRDYFQVWHGGAVVLSAVLWFGGVGFLWRGLRELHPEIDLDVEDRNKVLIKNEADILKYVRRSLVSKDPIERLTKCTIAECKVLEAVSNSSRWFKRANVCFFLTLAVALGSFIWWGYKYPHDEDNAKGQTEIRSDAGGLCIE